ncbi:FusB/FusC family EF-G-binding protein [Enterococcus gallinarum]|uniref:FusB/FusC family EF-G-binding protein n=1 Tax=Enterococcus gallinarum TaxID=1353 RepID=UPI001D10B652|nr:FusB/FusC family EF-G-binding protein [Enterococcus gallinarum]MCC2753114.1 FusB/FusC family EF-G-binding protein [Enterococcus gallinarum]
MITIEPYQFHFIKHQVQQLVRTYQSVNDRHTIRTVEMLTEEAIQPFFSEEDKEAQSLIRQFFDSSLTMSKSLTILEALKKNVRPFQVPSVKQTEKLFRKVKKLKVPDFSQTDLRDYTYLAWDDIGSQSKFMIVNTQKGYQGIYGHLSIEVKKGICPLCQHESTVSMFLSLTKSGGDGTYTKRGNYICRDSEQCNQQMEQRETLDEFVSLLQMR